MRIVFMGVNSGVEALCCRTSGMEDIRLRLRHRLNSRGIQLWAPPYRGPDAETHLQVLADEYAAEFDLPKDVVMQVLMQFQRHSLDRVSAKERFESTGIATLRVSTTLPVDGNKNFLVETKLDETGDDLTIKIAKQLSIEKSRLKLIHQGHIIKNDTTLFLQHIKNGSPVLAIVLSGTPEGLRKNADMYKILNRTRKDAEILSENSIGSTYMQLENQSGNTMNLPAKEKKTLMIAVTLHERGRAAIKSGDYSLALIFFLESDKYFKECDSKILKSVDNYGLLNLDIAWCYLCLQSITHIPDAESRLNICEKNFQNSYGQNFERLVTIKGTTGNERALITRLHLLKGIVLYYQNKRNEAKAALSKAQTDLYTLKIDENSVGNLVEMGFSVQEAKRGLMSSEGSVEGAIKVIQESRKQKLEREKKAYEEQENRQLGLCEDKKQFVLAKFVQMLVDMGYSRNISVLALKKSNNIITDAIQIIEEQPETLKESDLPPHLLTRMNPDPNNIKTLVDIGYNITMVEEALKQCSNNLENAIDLLINSGGVIEIGEANPKVSGQSTSKVDETMKKKLKKMTAAAARLSEDIKDDADDYLDLTFEQEEKYLNEYLSYLM